MEHSAKLERYLAALDEELAEVVACIDLLGMTVEKTAEELGRPQSTV